MAEHRKYTFKEEVANSITHGIGFLLSIVGLVFLILRALDDGYDRISLVSFIVFGSSMILLYLCSTLLHSMPFQKTRRLFTILDHSAIYVLIAGTYTPFLLVTLGGTLGWVLFGIIWGMAALGIVFKSIFSDKFSGVATLGYLVMGWMIIFAWRPLYYSLDQSGVNLLFIGGLFYSVGTIFYLWEKLPFLKKICLPFTHAIWHLFVLSGSACMFFSVLLFV